MPSSEFLIKYDIKESFRNKKVQSMFDLQSNEIRHEYNVNIPIDDKPYNIGLIVGASGSGKSTIARSIFPEDKYLYFTSNKYSDSESVVDSFNKNFELKDIIEILSKVGFSSPPEWLKPYKFLSNGQKFRVDLAKVLLEENKIVIFDEFSSVVDRHIAQITSNSIAKYIRKNNKKFIAVSCHYDIIDWLQPDWVYDVNERKFYWREVRQRPSIELKIRRASTEEFSIFKQYHYLSASIHPGAKNFIGEINNKPVCFCSIISFPSKVAHMRRVHRIVVLPDYQGLGIGIKFLNQICSHYIDSPNIYITTSSPSMFNALLKDNNWCLIKKPSFNLGKHKNLTQINKTVSYNRLTTSFKFKKM